MKKTTKTFIATTLGTATLLTTAFAAQPDKDSILYVNQKAIENSNIVVENDTVLIPLRSLCEDLGFEVNWDDAAKRIEIVKSPVYITCTPFEDGYTFSKTAPLKLGTAPKLINDRTYVPVNFIDEVMGATYEKKDNNIFISYGEENNLKDVIFLDKDDKTVSVSDFELGEVILNITEETVMEDEDGNKLTIKDIDDTNELKVEYSPVMTLSLPPMTNAVKIIKTNALSKELMAGKVEELVYDDNKVLTQIVISDKEDEKNLTALNITEETYVLNADGEAGDLTTLKKGDTISGVASKTATKSIPAQKTAYKVRLDK